VLQGLVSDRDFNEARRLLGALDMVVLGGADVAVEAARNFRRLRAKGLIVRKTIDTIIATRCIVSGLELLHNDRDFDPFEQHLGLRAVNCETPTA
jgi:predicted nucleic acid-binding protein